MQSSWTVKFQAIDFLLISELVKDGSEADVLIKTKEFVKNYGSGCIEDHLIELKLSEYIEDHLIDLKLYENIDIQAPLLCAAVIRGFSKLVKYLLQVGNNKNSVITSDNPEYHLYSALMLACEFENFEIANNLLSNDALVSHVSSTKKNALMCSRSAEMCALVLKKKQGYVNRVTLKKLLTRYNENDLPSHPYDSVILQELFLAECALIKKYKDDEKTILKSISRIRCYHLDNLEDLFNFIIESREYEDIEYSIPLPIYLTMKNFTFSLKELLILGCSPNIRMLCDKEKEIKYGPCLLSMACVNDQIEIVAKLLTYKNINLLATAHDGTNALMSVSSVAACKLLLDAAKKHKCFKKILSHTDHQNRNVFHHMCSELNVDIVEYLINIQNWQKNEDVDINKILHRTRIDCRNSAPEDAVLYEKLIELLRPLRKMKVIEYDEVKKNWAKNFKKANKVSFIPSLRLTKSQRIHDILMQHKNLLLSPDKCLPYLQLLSSDLERYFNETYNKAFPVLDSNTYKFEIIDSFSYPIPSQDYIGIKKYSALQEYLILFFRMNGIAQYARKWLGYIPNKDADAMLANGDFVIESKIGSGLFHGHISHMLQHYILIQWFNSIKKNNTNKFDSEITIKDLLHALMARSADLDGENLWARIRDSVFYKTIVFSDPLRLGSIIMSKGHELGMTALADSLIDSFCKGLQLLLKANIKKFNDKNLTLEKFVNQMKDCQLSSFVVTPKVLKYDFNKHLKKYSLFQKKSSISAVVTKEYLPNNNFVPKEFGIDVTSPELIITDNKLESSTIQDDKKDSHFCCFPFRRK